MTPRVALITTGLARGGAETQVVSLARELERRGSKPAIVSLTAPEAFERELSGIPVFPLNMRPGRPDPRGVVRLAAILRRLRPLVLHSHMFHANILARIARLIYPAPVVISTLHSAAESGHGSRDVRRRDRAYRITDPLADVVVAVSEAVAERHAASRAARRNKLRVIPNGVDAVRFGPDPDLRARMRRDLGIEARFVWLAAGRLIWKKNFKALLEAFAGQRGATLLIAGAGPEEAELRALAAELGGDARFLGCRDDMPALMNAADAFVLSSVVEGLPMALLEAAASGLASVAADAGGVRDIVSDGETGFVVPPSDPGALGVAMTRLAALPPEARSRMSAAARERVLARFEISAVADQWEELYRELLERARPWT